MTAELTIPMRLQSLFDVACDEIATRDQLLELEELVGADEQARRIYFAYCQLHVDLHFVVSGRRCQELIREGICAQAQEPIIGPAPTFLSTALHGTIGYFSEGMPLAYLLATVITGLGLLVGSLIHVSGPEQVAKISLPGPVVVEPTTEFVGRITGIVDCKWASGSRVSLGQKLDLASGLMEITYDTGAKIILQGPVTYEVESNGGFLQIGKLTGKVTTETARGLTVRTRTVTVTDLGTEFGVEVRKNGTNEVHVLKGMVQAEFCDSGGQKLQTLRLKEGEARQYQPGHGQAKSIPFDGARFERMYISEQDERYRRWLAYSRHLRGNPALVAYYTFEPVGANNQTLQNMSAAGTVLDGHVEGAEWVRGRFPDKFALRFHGVGSGDKVVLPQQNRFKFSGAFSVAVWFKVEQFTANHQALITKGEDSWRVQRHIDSNLLTLDVDRGKATPSHSSVLDGRWHLAVAVYEPVNDVARTRVYIDRRLEADEESPYPLRQNDEPVWLGSISTKPGREFQGLIDEAAFLNRALSSDEVAAMFQAGAPYYESVHSAAIRSTPRP